MCPAPCKRNVVQFPQYSASALNKRERQDEKTHGSIILEKGSGLEGRVLQIETFAPQGPPVVAKDTDEKPERCSAGMRNRLSSEEFCQLLRPASFPLRCFLLDPPEAVRAETSTDR
jgi:hypothetical protein